MKYEASVLKQNPMLIQKIIAERLSDKLQIMMVPMDGKNFFAADVMRSAFTNQLGNTNANNGAPLRPTPRTIRTMLRQWPPPRRKRSRHAGHRQIEEVARAASHEHRPNPCWVARSATLEEKP